MAGGLGRILVVDDEPALLSLVQQFLHRLGYQVEAFSSAQEAFQRFEADPSTYSLVVMDILMPEMSGSELLLRLLERNPKLRVLVCTGCPFSLSTLPPQRRQQVLFLQKPFAPQMLAEAVRRLFGEPEQPAPGSAQEG